MTNRLSIPATTVAVVRIPVGAGDHHGGHHEA